MFNVTFNLFFLCIVLVIVIIVMTNNKNKIDKTSNSYRQGYTDGREYTIYQQKINAASTAPSDDHQKKPFVSGELYQSSYSSAAVDITQGKPVIDSPAVKEKSKLQGINTALYVAGILLVGGVSLFVSMVSLSAVFKYVFLWLVVLTFYITGFILKDRVPILKPAAVAFVCTALAILPFTGFLMFDLIIQDATVCWLATSIIAFVAYLYASVRLNSQTLVYLSIASFISIASASVSTTGVALLWYSVVIILIGAVCTLAVRVWSNSIPDIYKRPLMNSGQVIVPATLMFSLVMAMSLSLVDYVIIFGITTLYYFANAISLQLGDKNRSIFWLITRLLGSITVLILSYQVSLSSLFLSYTFFGIGLLQFFVSSMMLPKKQRSVENQNEIWLWLGGVMAISPIIFATSASNWKEIYVAYLVLIGLASICSSVWLRRAEICLFGLFSLFVLPVVGVAIGLNTAWIASTAWSIVAVIYLLLASLLFIAKYFLRKNNLDYAQKIMFHISIFLFVFAVMIVSLLGIPVYLQAIIWAFAAIVFYGYCWLEREAALAVFGNISTFIGIIQFSRLIKLGNTEQLTFVSWVSLAVFFAASLVFRKLGEKTTKIYNIMWITAVIAGGVVGLMAMSGISSEVTMVEFSARGGKVLGSTLSVNRLHELYMIASLAVCCVGAIFALQDYFAKRLRYIDISVILGTIGLTAIVGTIGSSIHALLYVHWWALAFGSLAYAYYYFQNKPQAKARLIIALSVLSLFTMGYAFSGKIEFQVLFLIEHTLLVAFGLVVSYKLLTVWGAVGVSSALLWMLSAYSPILLSLAGLILLAIVIYVIIKNNKKKIEEPGESDSENSQLT